MDTRQAELEERARERGTLLRELGLMDPTPEHEFDELLELATAICGMPLGAMTLLDEETQLMKARVGFSGSPTMPVRQSICQHTVRGTDLMMVEDTQQDQRFAGKDSLPEDCDIRFYAGVPLVATNGCAVGALCVMDTEPATLSDQQKRALEILARQISNQIRMRERAAAAARMAEERERGREMFNTILDNIPIEVYLKDARGQLRFYNAELAARFGISKTDWLGKTSRDLWDAQTAESIVREDEYAMRHGKPYDTLTELHEPDGNTSYWRTVRVRCQSMNGENVLACCSIDLTEQMQREAALQSAQDQLEEANRKLSSLALTDSLTGLWNRRAFDSRLETSVVAMQRSHQSLALMLIDVDNFKSINDRFGHPYGDVVLKNMAEVLNRTKRAEDVACRFGGEEFAILLPGSDMEGAQQLARRILDAVRSFVWEKSPVTVSIGLAMCTPTCSSDDLIDNADAALYAAKRKGKDCVVLAG